MGQNETKIKTIPPARKGSGAKVKSKIPVVSPLDLNQFAKDSLRAHNDYRKAHHASPIFLDKALMENAQKWADHLAEIDSLDHREDKRYGENLYFCEGFYPTGFRTVQRWYEESKAYDFDSPHYSSETGHFTQLVWKTTRKFGIGVGRSSTGNFYVVANYDPPGNIRSHFTENVLRCGADQPKEIATTTAMNRLKMTFYNVNKFKKNCLAAHNAYRAHHSVPPLKMGLQISKEAQEWAENLATENKMQAHTASMYGENIYSVNKPKVTARMAVDAWYQENRKYTGTYSPETGHFTQVIWAASTELGIGVARSTGGQVYVVAYYFPPGNIQGEYEANVRNWKKD